jgi:hypothetical protein
VSGFRVRAFGAPRNDAGARHRPYSLTGAGYADLQIEAPAKRRGERSAGKRGSLAIGFLSDRRDRPRRLRGVSFSGGRRRLPALHCGDFGPRTRSSGLGVIGAFRPDPASGGVSPAFIPLRPATEGGRSLCRRTGPRGLPGADDKSARGRRVPSHLRRVFRKTPLGGRDDGKESRIIGVGQDAGNKLFHGTAPGLAYDWRGRSA